MMTTTETVEDVWTLAAGMMDRQGRRRAKDDEVHRSDVSRRHGRWLACCAFDRVFRRRQTKHAAFVQWLRASLAQPCPSSRADRRLLERVVGTCKCI
ncbi:hypothetical protein IWX90DRAFT_115025 [Phyllosticta citrichinensis]|uniref:Uncharacterized protein n=1 Tax=Phyllosticta citrichinensis TaxID=1130410 RepID=A0ABR1Y399_9PEZI